MVLARRSNKYTAQDYIISTILLIERFDSVEPSCLFLRGYTVTTLRLMFVRSLVVRLRNVQTIRDHKEYLPASEKECNKSRQASVSFDKWS